MDNNIQSTDLVCKEEIVYGQSEITVIYRAPGAGRQVETITVPNGQLEEKLRQVKKSFLNTPDCDISVTPCQTHELKKPIARSANFEMRGAQS